MGWGMEVRQAERATGAVVQVFLLAGSVPTDTWSGNGHGIRDPRGG